MVFGGKKISLMAFNPVTLGWAGQLSTIIATFLFWCWNFLSNDRSQLEKSSDVIQAFLLASYWVGRVFTFLKQRGLLALPMTYRGPLMLAQTRTLSLSLLHFPPWQSAPLKSKVLSGSRRKNKPVSSALKISFGLYSLRSVLSSAAVSYTHRTRPTTAYV